MLDDGAVGDVFEGGLGRLGGRVGLGRGGGFLDEGFEDGLLGEVSGVTSMGCKV